VIINHYGYGDSSQGIASDRPATRIFDLPGRQSSAVEEPRSEPDQFLIAFRDKSIYSAIAYWVDGDTLHYFTAGNTHNQASVSLVDRELTAKLNQESGREVKLPAPK
jgi:endonuclease YncB( thermonuclease family)